MLKEKIYFGRYQSCFELQPTGMLDYMKKKTNEYHDNAQLRNSHTDTVKCTSVNGKLEAEVVANWAGHKNSRKVVKTYARNMKCWITIAKDPLLRKGSFKSSKSLEGY